jgi:hypothetical protein
MAIPIVRAIACGLTRFGVRPTDFLTGLGVAAEAREGFVPDMPVAEALGEIAKRRGLEHFGLDLARSISLGWFGSIDHGFSASATLGEAFAAIMPELKGCASYRTSCDRWSVGSYDAAVLPRVLS